MIKNKPTAVGIECGKQLSRLTNVAKEKLETKLREADALELMPEPCKSCAFVEGTFPNGCPETVMDALKCTMEGKPFFCHQRMTSDDKPLDICQGYLIARTGTIGMKPMETPWPYSNEPLKEENNEESVL